MDLRGGLTSTLPDLGNANVGKYGFLNIIFEIWTYYICSQVHKVKNRPCLFYFFVNFYRRKKYGFKYSYSSVTKGFKQ
jgi:hypothetical protein